jgi:hypothetical protein
VILTALGATYQDNELDLGDIGGIPGVLDAGQSNDSDFLDVISQKLKEAFGPDDINELARTHTSASLSPHVVKVPVDNFVIAGSPMWTTMPTCSWRTPPPEVAAGRDVTISPRAGALAEVISGRGE